MAGMPKTRRKRNGAGVIPDYRRQGRGIVWTGPDLWTTGSGGPSAARLMAQRLGFDWRAR